ncbi:hypothetical protein D1007_03325 [Hordeum vulgare]|nr:hypothetical protein D1007_03325 [Hordeum vulgare]
MDSRSEEDYSRYVREVSKVVEKLPEVNAPSGRVMGRGLLTLPVSEALRRWNDGETRDCGCDEGFPHGGVNTGQMRALEEVGPTQAACGQG